MGLVGEAPTQFHTLHALASPSPGFLLGLENRRVTFPLGKKSWSGAFTDMHSFAFLLP